MQPQNPSRPVMDVRMPARPAVASRPTIPPAPLPVHEAPTENAPAANPPASSPAGAPGQPAPAPQTSHPAQTPVPKPSEDSIPAKPRPPIPVQNTAMTSQAHKPAEPSSAGIIVTTLICMVVLAAIAIFIYLKSQ